MTDEEIELYRKELNELTSGLSDEKNESTIRVELEKLARKVGASTMFYGVRFIDSTYKTRPADTSVLINNIHQALQTASMVNMCSAATNGYKMATEASKSAKIQFWIASSIAIFSAVAAWAAVVCK